MLGNSMLLSSAGKFVSRWKTDNAGGSSSTQILIPTPTAINGYFNWGDGTSDYITSTTDPKLLHTFPSAGTYTVTFQGTITWGGFNSLADKLKILEISSFSKGFNFGTTGGQFYGCSNLVITATDAPTLGTAMNNAFRGTTFTSIPNIHTWNWPNVTTIAGMFLASLSYNDPNFPLTNLGPTTTAWNGAFNGAGSAMAFNQNLGPLNVSGMTNGTNFAANCTLSTANYDATLIAWESKLQSVVANLHFGSSTYTLGGAAATARAAIVAKGWTITDGGGV